MNRKIEDINEFTHSIIGFCFEIHNKLGPGFLERVYENALKIKLQQNNIRFESQKEFNVVFENNIIGKFRCDLLVEDSVIIELKSVMGFMPKIFQSQLISYLKASRIKTGLLINFGNTSCEVKRLSV
ncbi:MAG TPA: GxxExxY protein [Sphingobacterium sp.]|nr:GxxExxY protein [Sphingobacterium sp.]